MTTILDELSPLLGMGDPIVVIPSPFFAFFLFGLVGFAEQFDQGFAPFVFRIVKGQAQNGADFIQVGGQRQIAGGGLRVLKALDG